MIIPLIPLMTKPNSIIQNGIIYIMAILMFGENMIITLQLMNGKFMRIGIRQ
jgi:hypothetical protein